jgi:uncharacterized protein (TIGR03435 family)
MFRAAIILATAVVIMTAIAPLRAVAGVVHQSAAADAKPPAFEVASVKPTKTQNLSMFTVYPGGRFRATNFGLGGLIKRAYRLQDDQLIGGPSWVQSEGFDIEAKGEGDSSAEQLFLMLQTLLTERFKLTLRHETRELPTYTLLMARNGGKAGPQLTASSGADCVSPPRPGSAPDTVSASTGPACGLYSPSGHWTGRNTTIDSLASSLSRVVHRVVRNRTELAGTFDLDLQWTDLTVLLQPGGSLTDAPPPPDNPTSIFTALQEQLGLKLESTKGPVDVLVIDHVEHPTPD